MPDDSFSASDRLPVNRASARANLVDEMLGDLKPAGASAPKAGAPSTAAVALDAPRRVPFSTRLPRDIMEWARSAVYHTPGLTLGDLVAAALREELLRLEREQGDPFPKLSRNQRVPTGRPVGR